MFFDYYNNNPDPKRDDPYYNYTLLVYGFDKKGSFIAHFRRGDKEPVIHHPGGDIITNCLVFAEKGKENSFMPLVQKHIQNPKLRSWDEIGLSAFKDLIAKYERTGKVGGKIFTETLTNGPV